MIYPASREIAVINRMRKARAQISNKDIAFAVEAARVQLHEHLPLLYPDQPIWNVAFYEGIEEIDIANVWPVALLDFDGNEGSNALHYAIGGLIGGTVDCLNNPDWMIHLTHETVEIACNPYLLEWREIPPEDPTAKASPILTPRESADPVQDTDYVIPISMGGVRRDCRVTNFVGARYWGEPAPDDQPLDFMETLSRPFQLGRGYRVLKVDGKRSYEFAAMDSRIMGARKTTPASRTGALMQGLEPAVNETGRGGYLATIDTKDRIADAAGVMCFGETPADALAHLRKMMVDTHAQYGHDEEA